MPQDLSAYLKRRYLHLIKNYSVKETYNHWFTHYTFFSFFTFLDFSKFYDQMNSKLRKEKREQ